MRGKLVALFAAVLGVAAVSLVAYFPARMAGVERTALQARARELLAVLALNVGPAVDFDDRVEMGKALAALEPVEAAVYGVVRSASGAVLAAWRPDKVPARTAPVGALLEDGAVLHSSAEVRTKQGASATVSIGVSLDRLNQARRGHVATVVVVALALFAGGLFALVVIGSIVVKPLSSMTAVALEIARGDLAAAENRMGGAATIAAVAGESFGQQRDEVRRLSHAFARMLLSLRDTTQVMHDSASRLTRSVEDLAQAATAQTEMVSRQATALQQTQVTAQEIKQTSQHAAARAEEILQGVARADQVSKSGESAISGSVAMMEVMLQQVGEISKRMNELNDCTQQIGRITDTVKDLADQSNMLALNAAIEAVRSGEHGKGFAVVAREIRSLADQSIQATGHVREILGDVSQASHAAVGSTERGTQQILSGVKNMQASGENLRELASILSTNSGTVRQIVATITQQAAGITQIFTAVTDLHGMMRDTMGRLESTNEAIRVVRDVSERVAEASRRYTA
jgi:methyl-accepting chemotaxis protein